MIKSTAIEIIKTFSKEDFKSFADLAESPYFNKNTNLVKLVKYLKKVSPDFKDESMRKEFVWNAIFPGRKFSYGVMKNLIYELNKLAEKYLVLEDKESEKFSEGYKLLRQLKQRALTGQFEKKMKAYKLFVSKSKLRLGTIYNSYLLDDLEQVYFQRFAPNKSSKFTTENSNKYLLSFFFSTFFYINYNFLITSKIYSNLSPEYKLIEQVVDFFENSEIEKDVISKIYFTALYITVHPENEEKYYELKKLFNENLNILDRRTSYNLGAIIFSYCKAQISKNENKFLKEQFDLIDFILKNKVYTISEKDYFDPNLYVMIIEISLKLNKLNWCEKFIHSFKDRLNPVNKKNHKVLGEIFILRHKKDFNSAFGLLSEFIPRNIQEKIYMKKVELKMHFEKNELDRVLSLIKSNKEFIRFDKNLSEFISNAFNNFLVYLKKLADIKINIDAKSYDLYYLNNLKDEIIKTEMYDKIWLFDILDNLEIKLQSKKVIKKIA
ncbi:MAG: hypothetical protein WBQ38_15775 [Ignavibacteria bacterium]|nr:hypothetical protein [Ignavibacteria bacterium]